MKLRNSDGTVPSIDARELARAEEQVKRALGKGATRLGWLEEALEAREVLGA